ncbi:oxidoreductase, partial [Stenotrophomonas maltophilia]
DLNITSTYLTTHAVVPHMREGAAIVNFASQAGRCGTGRVW